jgi:hypothetical protein
MTRIQAVEEKVVADIELEQDKLLRPEQIADYLGQTVRWVMREGRVRYGLPLIYVGGAVRSRKLWLDEWIADQPAA